MRSSTPARVLLVSLASGVVVFMNASLPAHAQSIRNRCANCHIATPFDRALVTTGAGDHVSAAAVAAARHLDHWDRSPHGRHDVGCETCHGGNPNTFESFQAHRGVLTSRNPASPVHRSQIPYTCGSCHAGPLAEYHESRHFELLGDGDRRVPVCTTCHGTSGAHLLSPRALERQCNECHGPSGVAPRPGRSAEARLLLEGISDVRDSLNAAQRLIDRVDDDARRAHLEDAFRRAETPLTLARAAGHRFMFDRLRERLASARRAAGELLVEIANPSP